MSLDLLIVFHSQSGTTAELAHHTAEGASLVTGIVTQTKQALEVTSADLLSARVLVICSPEYFGYMAGCIKDMFDRNYDKVRDQMIGKKYAIVISAGNDGTGALQSIERIIAGFKMKRVQDPIIAVGPVDRTVASQCITLGQTLAAGIELGIY